MRDLQEPFIWHHRTAQAGSYARTYLEGVAVPPILVEFHHCFQWKPCRPCCPLCCRTQQRFAAHADAHDGRAIALLPPKVLLKHVFCGEVTKRDDTDYVSNIDAEQRHID